jgi:hypothetical protein
LCKLTAKKPASAEPSTPWRARNLDSLSKTASESREGLARPDSSFVATVEADTYCNLHEPTENEYVFSNEADIERFLRRIFGTEASAC